MHRSTLGKRAQQTVHTISEASDRARLSQALWRDGSFQVGSIGPRTAEARARRCRTAQWQRNGKYRQEQPFPRALWNGLSWSGAAGSQSRIVGHPRRSRATYRTAALVRSRRSTLARMAFQRDRTWSSTDRPVFGCGSLLPWLIGNRLGAKTPTLLSYSSP